MKNKLSLYWNMIIGYTISTTLIVVSFIGAGLALRSIIKGNDPMSVCKTYSIFALIMGIGIVANQLYQTISNSHKLRIGMSDIIKTTKALSEGDTDIEINTENNDEFGEILKELKVLVDNTRDQAEAADAVAGGDLTVKIVPKSDKDMMGVALKTLVEKNLDALLDINTGAYQVMTSSSQVASASESLAQGSTEQASAIEEVTASIAEVAEKTMQNANEANKAAGLVNQVIEDVKAGNKEMGDMLDAMNDINQSSESISKIIKVIDDIAFQTNILALNAAVEAARAGDAGKGFAVVADEVRNLAAKSAQAAAETAELIEDSITKVGVGSNLANNTFKALEEITRVVKESEALITGIAASSNYQATAVAQINQAIGQISQVVQTNSATSEQCAAAADELSGQAARMRELISVYNLGEDSNYGVVAPKKVMPTNNINEKIISLGEDFGKY